MINIQIANEYLNLMERTEMTTKKRELTLSLMIKALINKGRSENLTGEITESGFIEKMKSVLRTNEINEVMSAVEIEKNFKYILPFVKEEINEKRLIYLFSESEIIEELLSNVGDFNHLLDVADYDCLFKNQKGLSTEKINVVVLTTPDIDFDVIFSLKNMSMNHKMIVVVKDLSNITTIKKSYANRSAEIYDLGYDYEKEGILEKLEEKTYI